MTHSREMNRRSFLAKATAAAVGTTALGGCGGIFSRENEESWTPPPPSEDSPSTPGDASRSTTPSPFETRVDLTEYGADPSGEEPIGEAIEEAAGDDRLLYLPPGEYRVEEEISITDLSRFGLVGEDATIVPAESLSGVVAILGTTEGPLHIENLQFDFTNDGANARAIDARTPDGLVLRNVSVRGRLRDGRGPVRVDVTGSDGSGLVERLHLPDGSVPNKRVTGCLIGDENRGEITFRDCHIEGFADNGLYGDPTHGRLIVEGGYYANNGISNVRVRAGSVVRNVHVRCDDGSRDLDNMRGIRLTNSERSPHEGPAVVENCRIELANVTYSDGAITLDSTLQAAHIRNTEILVDADNVRALWAKAPSEELRIGDLNHEIECRNVTVTGKSSGGAAVRIDDRDGNRLESLKIIQTARNRDGISLQRSSDNVLRSARFDVGGTPIVLNKSTLETFDIEVGADIALTETVTRQDD